MGQLYFAHWREQADESEFQASSPEWWTLGAWAAKVGSTRFPYIAYNHRFHALCLVTVLVGSKIFSIVFCKSSHRCVHRIVNLMNKRALTNIERLLSGDMHTRAVQPTWVAGTTIRSNDVVIDQRGASCPIFLKFFQQFEWRSRSNSSNSKQHSVLGWLEHSLHRRMGV